MEKAYFQNADSNYTQGGDKSQRQGITWKVGGCSKNDTALDKPFLRPFYRNRIIDPQIFQFDIADFLQ
jgi:hypothetical protein